VDIAHAMGESKHSSGMDEARVVKFCTSVGQVKC